MDDELEKAAERRREWPNATKGREEREGGERKQDGDNKEGRMLICWGEGTKRVGGSIARDWVWTDDRGILDEGWSSVESGSRVRSWC